MKCNETVSEWNGFECRDFEFEGRSAKIVFPKERDPMGRWLLKTEYFGAFPNFEIEMLKRGYHLAYVANITRWMVPDDVDVKDRFAAYLEKEYGLNPKCVPVGMSCGGLHGTYFAAKYPERVAVLYLDAPVMNLLSCPAAVGRVAGGMLNEFINATGITLSELINHRNHPIDHKEELSNAKIPVLMVYGDSDDIVPYHENGKYLEAHYKAVGGDMLAIGKAGCGHHPHGLEDPTPMIEFIEKRYV